MYANCNNLFFLHTNSLNLKSVNIGNEQSLTHFSLSLLPAYWIFTYSVFIIFYVYFNLFILSVSSVVGHFILSFCFSVIYFFAFCFLSSLTLPPVLFHNEYLSSILCYVFLCMSQALIIFSTISQFFLHSHI